jgi:hypothetical protein
MRKSALIVKMGVGQLSAKKTVITKQGTKQRLVQMCHLFQGLANYNLVEDKNSDQF